MIFDGRKDRAGGGWIHSLALLLIVIGTSGCSDRGGRPPDPVDRSTFLDLPACIRSSERAESSRLVILSGPESDECEIVVWSTGVKLSSNRAGTIPDPRTPIAVTSKGEFVTRTSVAGQFAVWDPTGSFSKTIGRQGEGPGEILGYPTIQIDPWDSVHIKDSKARWSVFSPDFIFRRVVVDGSKIFSERHTLFHESGEIVTAYGLLGVSAAESLFRVIDRSDGRVLRGFGTPGQEEGNPRRNLVSASDSTFWSLPWHEYRAEEWTFSGERVRVMERRADWFPQGGSDSPWDQTKGPPPPTVSDLYHDSAEDLLWVRLMIPDPNLGNPASAPEGLEAVGFFYDIVLEVIDLRSWEVLASLRTDGLDGSISAFLQDGRGVRVVEDESGLRSIEVLEIRVVQKQNPSGGTR